MTPHIHRWDITTREDGITLYTCRTPGCKRQMRIEEFDAIDPIRPPEPRPVCTHDADFAGEANDYRNLINGIAVGLTVTGVVLAITWIVTGRLWPIGG